MKLRLNNRKGLSLLEVIITTGILSTAIVFILRSFTVSLSAAKLSQNITLGCYLAEEKIWDAREKQSQNTELIENEEKPVITMDRNFNLKYSVSDLEDADYKDLVFLELSASWKQNAREKDYQMQFFTYLMKKQ